MLRPSIIAVATATALLAGCGGDSGTAAEAPKNVLFFLGDGMGINTMTAARIYKVGEEGELTMDTLPETAFIKTYSNNAQVTDSAPSMAAYMTGVKMNNEVISMTPDTSAFDATGKNYLNGKDSTCPTSGNGKAVTTLLELAKSAGWATGVVTTTRVTHATPAVTYSHICHRDGENDIAAQFVPGSAKYNTALGDGVDLLFGGGLTYFLPTTASLPAGVANSSSRTNGYRTDGVDLTALLTKAGYAYVNTGTDMRKIDATTAGKVVGLFNGDHLSYDIDRTDNATDEPSLSEMTGKAIDVLAQKKKGLFLMVEGGRIDHALHETTAKKALQDTVAFDNAVQTAITKMKAIDPDLSNTLIVVTADHDHTIVLNGYAARTGATTANNPGVLGLLKNFVTGALNLDADGNPFTIIGFGNGENRPATRSALTDAQVATKTYHQEAAVPMSAGSETHGGTDVFLGAIGRGADKFTGVITNTEVFNLIRQSVGL